MIIADFIVNTTSSLFASLISDRYLNKNNPINQSDDVDSVAARFVLLFENHGVHRNQIYRVFDHGLTLNDVSTNKKLLKKLNKDILRDACEMFSARLEWIEGVDSKIYKTHSFYKDTNKFVHFVNDLLANTDKNGGYLVPRLVITTDTTKDYDALLIIEEHLESDVDSVVRYHLCNNWVHRYWKSRADITACIAIAFKRIGFVHGQLTNLPIEDFCRGEGFIADLYEAPIVFERNIFYKKVFDRWKPEDWVFEPKSFTKWLEEGHFGKVSSVSRLLSHYDDGYMETKYSGYDPEPKFREYYAGLVSKSFKKL